MICNSIFQSCVYFCSLYFFVISQTILPNLISIIRPLLLKELILCVKNVTDDTAMNDICLKFYLPEVNLQDVWNILMLLLYDLRSCDDHYLLAIVLLTAVILMLYHLFCNYLRTRAKYLFKLLLLRFYGVVGGLRFLNMGSIGINLSVILGFRG